MTRVAVTGAGGFLPSGLRRIAPPPRFDVIDNTAAPFGECQLRPSTSAIA